MFPLRQYVAELSGRCPAGFQVDVQGAFPIAGGELLSVCDGNALVVSFVLMQPAHVEEGSDDSGIGSSVHTLLSESEDGSSSESSSDPQELNPAGPPPPRPMPGNGQGRLRRDLLPTLIMAACLTPVTAGALSVPHTFCPAFGYLEVAQARESLLCLLGQSLALCLLCGRTLKLLSEPECERPATQQAVAALRSITRLMGWAWPYLPPSLDAFFAPEVIDDQDHVSQETGVLINFVVLKPEYVKETASLSLTLPCTLGEATEALQSARTTEDFIRFPHLQAVHPQSVPGHAVFVARPRWYPTAIIICVNTLAIDGRLFAAYTGEYADYDALCWHADLPSVVGYQVYVGGDDQPLPPGVRIHLADGMQAIFVPDDDLPSLGLPLPLLLTRSEPWHTPRELPEPDIRDAYLLVSRDNHVLHIEDFGRPFRFRENIAARAGIGARAFHILPADPPVRNVAIVGVTCRTILAACVCPSGVDRCRGAFFDLRPIQEGIRFVCRDDPTVDLDSLTAAMAEAAPIGWGPQIRYDDWSELSPPSHPGAVFTVEYVPHLSADPGAEEAAHTAASDAIDAGAHSRGQQGGTGQSHAGGHHGSNEAPGSDRGGDTPPGEEAPPDPRTPNPAAPLEGDRVPLHFLLYSPEYKPEGFAPGLVPPLLFSVTVEILSQLRAAEDHRRSPRLLPVHPQPQHHPAAMLALPAWPSETVAVLFDCHIGPRRVFAACVPRFFTRADAMFMARVDLIGDCDVFHRDIPWPIPEGYWIYPDEGDLIAFYPAGASQDHAIGFHQLLQGEARAGPLPFGLWDSETTWVLSDGPHVAVPIPEDQFALNSAQTAAALGLRPGHFLLVPTIPEIVDHSRHGTPSRRALISVQTDGELDVNVRHRVPYVLDLRPIHLYLSSAFAPDGVADVAAICVRIYGGVSDADEGNHARRVVAGDILTVEFHPDFVRDVVNDISPGSYTPAVSAAGSADPVGDAPSASSGLGGPGLSDAGTGGSWHPASSSHEHAWFGYKWLSPSLCTDAIVDGTGTTTPIIQDQVQAMLFVLDFCRLLRVHQHVLPVTHDAASGSS